MGLFSKKPGGTFFGNLLRGIGATVSSAVGVPGLLGSGANKIELGQTKTNAQLYAEASAQQQQAGTTIGVGIGNGLTGNSTNTSTMWMVIAGVFGAIAVALIAFKDKVFGKSKHYHGY